jgi:hypothetical protein
MKKICGVFLVFLFSVFAFGQLDATLEKKIDALFIDWNTPNHPGGAVGIVMDGRLVYSKAFGLASLEYLVPNTPGTRFNIASVSKQFTALGIVKLHLQGKLSVDDDVRNHIPELQDFGHTVTLRHMLHHTSGLRSLHALLSLAGWRGDDSRTNEDLMRFMREQKDLNFVPGEEYMYSNTGFILMAVLIEKLTGEDFPTWMKREKANAISDILFDHPEEQSPSFEMEAVEIDPSRLDLFAGTYTVNEDPERLIDIIKEKDALFFQSTGRGRVKLSPAGANVFFNNQQQLKIVFDESDETSYTMTQRGREYSGSKTVKFVPAEKDLMEIAGHYWSPELKTHYSFFVREGKLFGYHTRHGEFQVVPFQRDIYHCRSAPMSKITVERDSEGQITGLYLTNNRVRNLWVEKMN